LRAIKTWRFFLRSAYKPRKHNGSARIAASASKK
jgi:hypothetical protein